MLHHKHTFPQKPSPAPAPTTKPVPAPTTKAPVPTPAPKAPVPAAPVPAPTTKPAPAASAPASTNTGSLSQTPAVLDCTLSTTFCSCILYCVSQCQAITPPLLIPSHYCSCNPFATHRWSGLKSNPFLVGVASWSPSACSSPQPLWTHMASVMLS